MALIKGRQVVDGDPWAHVPDDAPVPAKGDVVVGLSRYRQERDALAQRAGRVGVRIDPGDVPFDLDARDLEELPLIAVSFPKFTDGRGYSHARLLRDRQGYRGELRAVGHVLGDQLRYMERCGMDSFELTEGKDVQAALACMDSLTVTYQGAADDPRPRYRR